MDEIFIDLRKIEEIPCIKNYFYKKDFVSIEDIINAFEFELERLEPVESEPSEEDERFNYEYDTWKDRQAEEYANDR